MSRLGKILGCLAFIMTHGFAFAAGNSAPHDSPVGYAKRLAVKDISPSEWSGQFSAVKTSSTAVIVDSKVWQEVWSGIGKPAPKVDFKKYVAVAIFLGTRNTGGYDAQLMDPEPRDGEIQIRYKIRAPGRNAMVIEALTQPYRIKLYRRVPVKLSIMRVK